MSWPDLTDYNEAVQNPAFCFQDADLRRGRASADALGCPRPWTGNFAAVYKVELPGGMDWGVKCFTREAPGLQARYQAASNHLRGVPLPFLVDFAYLEPGIRVGGTW